MSLGTNTFGLADPGKHMNAVILIRGVIIVNLMSQNHPSKIFSGFFVSQLFPMAGRSFLNPTQVDDIIHMA
jgi:hypothetical protein